MEPKVIRHSVEVARRSGVWSYDATGSFCQQSGSANNWSFGYMVHGPRHRDAMLDLIRRESERCDRLDGFLLLQSLAGGTGSGVGTYVTECIRDEYPSAVVLNHVVWPYERGEVIVQNYNAMLSLSHLYKASDALMLAENDALHAVCQRLLGIREVSFDDINAVIADNMSMALQTAYPWRSAEQRPLSEARAVPFSDVVAHLAAHPAYKLLQLCTIPQASAAAAAFSSDQWPMLLKHLTQMLAEGAPMETGLTWHCDVPEAARRSKPLNKSVAAYAVVRGDELLSARPHELLGHPYLYAPWSTAPCFIAASGVPTVSHGAVRAKSAALISNSRSSSALVARVAARALAMSRTAAYVHHYARFGTTAEDFVVGCAELQQIVQDYALI